MGRYKPHCDNSGIIDELTRNNQRIFLNNKAWGGIRGISEHIYSNAQQDICY